MNTPQATILHYGTEDLIVKVGDVLRTAGIVRGAPWTALAPLDQFHVGGVAATTDLATQLEIGIGSTLLDVGCGLGGPARQLATEFGCSVTGIDLSERFVELANMLSEVAGLSDRVTCRVADAQHLPTGSQRFDFAWTQHVGMNIGDRVAFYAAIFAVLRPGGRLAIHDVVTGNGAPMQFPLPWARDPAVSFVLSAAETIKALEAAGFAVPYSRDVTAAGLASQQAQVAASQARPDNLKRLGLALVMGPEFPAMVANLGRNLREGRAGLFQAVAVRTR